jgi:hypothetical protein
MTHDHTGHAASGCNSYELMPVPPRLSCETPVHLQPVRWLTPRQPTLDEALAALNLEIIANNSLRAELGLGVDRFNGRYYSREDLRRGRALSREAHLDIDDGLVVKVSS